MEFLQEDFINNCIGNAGLEKAYFPFFDIKKNNRRYFFNEINVQKGGLIEIKSLDDINKSILFETMCGLIIPRALPENKNFLKYKIFYKRKELVPKYEGTVLDLLESKELEKNNSDYYKIYYILKLNNFIEKNIKDLSQSELETLSLFLTITENSDIFIFDYIPNTINYEIRTEILEYLKKNSKKNNKYFISTDSFFKNYKSDTVKTYEISEINKDHYFGKMI